MKAAIFNPYLDTMGGGEKYTLDFARAISESGYKVYVQWTNSKILNSLVKRFGMKLDYINIIDDIRKGEDYDLCFWLSDGSIPLLKSRNNILHFQFPFKNVNGKSLLNKMKLYRINNIVCNSYFTKKMIDIEYGVNSLVIYPSIEVDKIKPKRKENIILSVGRFSQLTQAKRQDVLIDVYKKLSKIGFGEWKLVLAGGVEVGVDDYYIKLKQSAEKYSVEFVESPEYSKLLELYGKAKIFWTASGYAFEEEKNPKKVEHFGISLVEAMAAGAVPLAYKAGGHKEIIKNGKNGYLWQTKKGLRKKTIKLIGDSKLLRNLSKTAREDSQVYEYARFKAQFEEIL